MKVFSQKTLINVLAAISINLTSAWFGLLVVSPGLFGLSSLEEYGKLLINNLPFAILGLLFSLWLTEKGK